MAAETLASLETVTTPRRQRGAFALFAAVIVIAVIAVLATVVSVTLSGDNDQDRIEKTADVLHALVSSMDTVKSATGASFGGMVLNYPFRLSQLTHKISTKDLACKGAGGAGTLYNTTDSAAWRGPYFLAPIPTTGFPITPGFTANEQLVRVSTLILAIRMDNVSLADAKALELVVEKSAAGTGPVVVFALTDPTSVQYRLISSANIC